MNNVPPKLKTFLGVKALFKMVKDLHGSSNGQERLGLTLLFISISKVLDEEYRKSLMEKVTQIFYRK